MLDETLVCGQLCTLEWRERNGEKWREGGEDSPLSLLTHFLTRETLSSGDIPKMYVYNVCAYIYTHIYTQQQCEEKRGCALANFVFPPGGRGWARCQRPETLAGICMYTDTPSRAPSRGITRSSTPRAAAADVAAVCRACAGHPLARVNWPSDPRALQSRVRHPPRPSGPCGGDQGPGLPATWRTLHTGISPLLLFCTPLYTRE